MVELMQRRNIEEVLTDAEVIGDGCLSAVLYLIVCSDCFSIARVALPRVTWVLPYQSLIKKLTCRFAYSLFLMKAFSQLRMLLA